MSKHAAMITSTLGKSHIKIHQRVFRFCLSLLKRSTLTGPNPADLSNDRTTHVVLPPPDQKLALAEYKAYHEWLEAFIKYEMGFLSGSDVNLLRSNKLEIESYILMKRRGKDVSVKMYRDFYEIELSDLIKQQISICELVLSCKAAPFAAKKRRYWSKTPLTMGVEEEHQIVSSIDWELAHDVDQILTSTGSSQFSREVYKSQIEAKTAICENVQQVRKQLLDLRRQLKESLPSHLSVLSAGTHPFSTWNVQQANSTARTELFMHDMQDVVRRLVTFGLHVHIGVEDKEIAVHVINSCRQFLPFLLALSSSSPFWEGRDTGLYSFRSTVFSALPRTGIPALFDGYSDYEEYWDLLAKTHSFDSDGTNDPTKIWWDMRLHPKHPTVEFRICDACTTIDDAVCMAALCQSITAKVIKLLHEGVKLHVPAKHIIEENKWRAIRYGSRARFIDDLSKKEVTARYQAFQILDFVEDVSRDLQCHDEVLHVVNILEKGSSAYKQLSKYSELRGDAKKRLMEVVKWLTGEFIPQKRGRISG